MSLPEGYNSVIIGGEKQRIMLARAILKNSPIMIADEPLKSLDPENVEIIKDVIRDLADDKLVIMITHNEYDSFSERMNILFKKGKVTVTYK